MIDTWTISPRGAWEVSTPRGTVYTRGSHEEALRLAIGLAKLRWESRGIGKYTVRKAKES